MKRTLVFSVITIVLFSNIEFSNRFNEKFQRKGDYYDKE